VLGPLVGAIPERMHRAVKVNRRDGFVNLQDILHDLQVLVRSGTFIVDDDVIPGGPIGIVVDREWRIGRAVIGPDDIDADIGPFLNALVEDLVLGLIIVTATSGDEEGLEGAGTGGLIRGFI
jgi:hypothetical protein